MIDLKLNLPPGYALSSITLLRTTGQWCVYIAIPGARPGASDPIGGGVALDINEAARKAIENAEWRLANPTRRPAEYHKAEVDVDLGELGL